MEKWDTKDTEDARILDSGCDQRFDRRFYTHRFSLVVAADAVRRSDIDIQGNPEQWCFGDESSDIARQTEVTEHLPIPGSCYLGNCPHSTENMRIAAAKIHEFSHERTAR